MKTLNVIISTILLASISTINGHAVPIFPLHKQTPKTTSTKPTSTKPNSISVKTAQEQEPKKKDLSKDKVSVKKTEPMFHID